MHPARIAELLSPFLQSTSVAMTDPCHYEKRNDKARPERSRSDPAVLSPMQLQSISIYIDILLRWNARINLTAIRSEEEIVTRHFGESLFAARHLFPRRAHVGTAAPGCPAERSSADAMTTDVEHRGRASLHRREEFVGRQDREGHGFSSEPALSERRESKGADSKQQEGALAPEASPTIADLGSGAGFPGIPIKLWAPHISLTLIESNHKKATFLREITRALTLTDVNIQNVRAESLTGQHFDVVTLRAVEHFESILLTAARLIAPSGRLALLISSAQVPQAQSLLTRDDCLSLTWTEPEPVPLSRSRVLLIAHRV
jgi:16S rRNA (guanine(527)-N(7))-methyltransferase RsmG